MLEDKAKQLAGRGKRPNKARQISEEEEEVITQNHQFKHFQQFHEPISPFLRLATFKNIEKNVVLAAVMILSLLGMKGLLIFTHI